METACSCLTDIGKFFTKKLNCHLMCQSFGSYLTVSNLSIIVVLHNGHVDKLLSCEFGELRIW